MPKCCFCNTTNNLVVNDDGKTLDLCKDCLKKLNHKTRKVEPMVKPFNKDQLFQPKMKLNEV